MEEGGMCVGRCHRSSLKAVLEGKTSKEKTVRDGNPQSGRLHEWKDKLPSFPGYSGMGQKPSDEGSGWVQRPYWPCQCMGLAKTRTAPSRPQNRSILG